MKKLPILTLFFVVFFCACTSDYNNVANTEEVPVEVTFSGLDISVVPDESLSPAAVKTRVPADEAKVTRIAFKVYDSEGTEVYSVEKNKNTDSDFNNVRFPLHVGDYTFVAVAHRGKTENSKVATINTVSDATLPEEHLPAAIYSKTMSVNISGNTTQSVAFDFGKRITSSFSLIVNDKYPDDIEEIHITLNSSKSEADYPYHIDPSTGFAPTDCYYKDVFKRQSVSDKNFTGKRPISSFFLTAAEQTADVTIEMIDANDNILYSRTLHGVTFRQHSTTKATGSFFSSNVTGTFNFDTEDDPDINISLDQ